ncbi:hypothetical protein P154DRAFT_217803 [Amniculicola lignicola CBS 123094]|uniref:MYND-type domain-containing protein n=1 Tax=Amniculicola lignicola CBS 123094 TaxID=1392246 RepID=A0A6A5WZR8_9PLEO|nr:hypothetical protein P154DRAFT_217803 [Amniculicola lignicola CBS 123094]
MADAMLYCANCKNNSNGLSLRACSKCKVTRYCSRECQKNNWKSHKKLCSKQAGEAFHNLSGHPDMPAEHGTNYTTPRTKGLEQQIQDPFTRIDQHTYLHDRPETDVYKLLIDCFRMRQEDDNNFENKQSPYSIYSGASDSVVAFRHFLDLASSRSNLLPGWWNADKQKACEEFGMSDNWSSLKAKVSKQSVIDQYSSEMMPMQLRMLGETVYARGPGGQESASMRQVMMTMERGGPGNGMVASMLNINPDR